MSLTSNSVFLRKKHVDGSVTVADQPDLKTALENAKDGWMLDGDDPAHAAGKNSAALSNLSERQERLEGALLRLIGHLDGSAAAPVLSAAAPASEPAPAPAAPSDLEKRFDALESRFDRLMSVLETPAAVKPPKPPKPPKADEGNAAPE